MRCRPTSFAPATGRRAKKSSRPLLDVPFARHAGSEAGNKSSSGAFVGRAPADVRYAVAIELPPPAALPRGGLRAMAKSPEQPEPRSEKSFQRETHDY